MNLEMMRRCQNITDLSYLRITAHRDILTILSLYKYLIITAITAQQSPAKVLYFYKTYDVISKMAAAAEEEEEEKQQQMIEFKKDGRILIFNGR